MRIRLLSDLHEEFRHRLGPMELPAVAADVTVLAGDIGNGTDLVEVALRPCFDGTVKILVPGNHEFYDLELEPARRALREAVTTAMRDPAVRARGALHLLDDDCVVVDGVRFVGGTLWTDYLLHGEEGREAAVEGALRFVTDHRLVRREGGLPFTPEDSVALHHATRAFLEDVLAQAHDGPTVVVTHHAPHPDSVAERFAGNAINPAFVSDLSALMGRSALWLHGHTHDGFDYTVRGTRVVANPAGYRRKTPAGQAGMVGGFVFENPRFDPALVLTL